MTAVPCGASGRRWTRVRRAVAALAAVGVLISSAGGGALAWLAAGLPSPERLHEEAAPPSTRIYDRQGRLLYEIVDPHGGAHTPVTLDEVARPCVQATIATEDASFYTNPGVDGRAIIRALWINLKGGEILSGGSTITQQLARNLLLSPQERSQVTLARKLREMILAWRLARRYSKDEILALYLNETYYGNLAYGIEAAARAYFAKHASELNLAECALLAGLPQSPARYDPLRDPEAARARQRVVLGLMVKHGIISQEEADLAARERLGFAAAPFPILAPHFVMAVRAQLERELGLATLTTQGLEVYTTLDLDAHRTALRIMRRRLAQLATTRAGRYPRNVHNAAIVVMDPRTGEVLAMVGSPDYFDPAISGAVNAALTLRQPGSAIKPITYAAAFDLRRARPLTAATMMVDVRTAFVTREGSPYVPKNYDQVWHGPVLLRQALASSYNLVAIKVLDDVGPEAVAQLARAMGITSLDEPERIGLSLTLGGGEVSLLQLTGAYCALANGGWRVEPTLITRVEDRQGRVLRAWPGPPRQRVLDERVAYLITDILSDNDARAPAFGEASALRLSRPAAAKTGTTSDWRDNWTLGYTPDLAVGVWVGNADNAPMEKVSGVTGAAPIWHEVMETLLRGRPVREFTPPPGLVRLEVCADSGLPPAQEVPPSAARGVRRPARCPYTVNELFIAGSQPTQRDDWHWWYRLDLRNGLLAGPSCPAEFVAERRFTLYPAEAHGWARAQGIPQPPEAFSPLCPDGGAADIGAASPAGGSGEPFMLIISSPDPGSRYRLAPQTPRDSQQLLVAARPADGVAPRQVVLLVDGHVLATLYHAPYQARWPLQPGSHVFSAQGLDAEGRGIASRPVIIEVTE